MINTINNLHTSSRQKFGALHLPKRMSNVDRKAFQEELSPLAANCAVFVKKGFEVEDASIIPPRLKIVPTYNFRVACSGVDSEFSEPRKDISTPSNIRKLATRIEQAKDYISSVFVMRAKWDK